MDFTKLPSLGSPLSWLTPHQVQTSQLPRGTPRYEVHLCPENIFQDHSSPRVQPKCDPTISSEIIKSERGWPTTTVCLGLKESLRRKTFTTKIGNLWATQDELVRDHESVVIQLCLTFCDSMDCSLPGSSVHGILGKNTGLGCHSLFQGIFLTQGLNLGLLHYRQTLYSLSHYSGQTIIMSIVSFGAMLPFPVLF